MKKKVKKRLEGNFWMVGQIKKIHSSLAENEITKQKSTFFKNFKVWPNPRIKWVILSLIYSWNFFDLTLRLKVDIKKSAF